jgi:DNA-binding IclR family transcriptional regulator
MGVSEIAALLGLSKNLTFRISSALYERGYLFRNDDTKRYTLSRKLLTMGYGAESKTGLLESSLGYMRQLRDEVQETIVILTLVGSEGMVLESIPGLHPFRLVCETGMRVPLHASAGTKAILAYLPSEESLSMLEKAGLPKLTTTTLTTREEFAREVTQIRNLGYATDLQEGFEGIHCVGAPVFNDKETPIAAIVCTGPMNRLTESMFEHVGSKVRHYALRISQRLGYQIVL